MPIPLYHQIARTLSQEIAQQSGKTASSLPIDSNAASLPSEMALCQRFGVSRYTVRAALAQLEQEGLITRKKREGIRIAPAQTTGAFRENLGSLDDLVQLAATHEREVMSSREVVLTATRAQSLNLPAKSRWLSLETRRIDSRSPKHPICISLVLIDGQYASLLKEITDQPAQLISSLIEKHFGRRVTHVNQRISAVLLDKSMATSLNAAVGSPALEVQRQYIDRAGEVFEVATSVHPVDRFTLTMRLERTS